MEFETNSLLSQAILICGAGLITMVLGMLSQPIAVRLGVVVSQNPDEGRRAGFSDIPLTGGMMIVLPGLMVMLWSYLATGNTVFLGLMLVSAAYLFIGYLDDWKGLRPLTRLFAGFVIVWPAVVMFPSLSLTTVNFLALENVITVGAWGSLFTAVCIVCLANATNMADGKNGLVLGTFFVWMLIFLAYGPAEIQVLLLSLLFMAGITWSFNMRSKLFLGDSGSLTVGALAGCLAIYIYGRAGGSIPAETIVLWFWLPVSDMFRLIVQRPLNGRSPMGGDREHLHHLLYATLHEKRGLAVYLALTAVPNLVAYMLPGQVVWILGASIIFYAGLCKVLYTSLKNRDILAA